MQCIKNEQFELGAMHGDVLQFASYCCPCYSLLSFVFLARDVIYTSNSDPTLPRIGRRAAAAAVLLAGESSRAMLASARLSCLFIEELRDLETA